MTLSPVNLSTVVLATEEALPSREAASAEHVGGAQLPDCQSALFFIICQAIRRIFFIGEN
jgi:hypothetical protein